jgi:uncharacterized protein
MTEPSQPSRRASQRQPVRRVSRGRYRVRRVGALVVVALLAVAAVKVGGVLVGSDDTDAASPDTSLVPDITGAGVTGDGGVTLPTDAPSADTEPPADPAATDSIAPTTEAGPPGPPSASDPALVLIAGDSDAGTFGPYLDTLLAATGVVTTQLDYKVSSGLSRPDFYDWPSHLRETVPLTNPDIVVVTFGGNDAQGLSTPGTLNFIVDTPTGEAGGDVEWRAEYGKRVGEVMDYLSADGRTLIWVGIPNAQDPDFTRRLAVQNEVVVAEAAKRPQVVFIDTWRRFSGRNGNWAEFVIDPRDGQGKDVRSDIDGFHLNETGAEILALDISDAVKAALRARGAAI